MSPEAILLRETAKKSLFFLCKLLGYKDVNETTHGEIIETLEEDTKRKLVCVPRGSLKSSIGCVAYPIWLLINNPNIRILIDSELYTNSKVFLREIRLHLESPVFREIFGDFVGDTWNESEIVIRQRTQIKKEASITVGGVGTTKVGQHYDCIISDDLNSQRNTNSVENAEKVIDHFKRNISILEPTGVYLLIGTRYSASDCIGFILKNELNIDDPKSGTFETRD